MTWEQAEQDARKTQLTCPVCSGTEFDREQGRMDSRPSLGDNSGTFTLR